MRGDGYDINAKYFFEYINRNTNIDSAWLTKNKNIVNEITSNGHQCYYFYSFYGLWFCMTAKVAVITHMGNNLKGDLPYFAINSNSTLVQLTHGIPLKKICFDDLIYSQRPLDLITKVLFVSSLNLFPYARRVTKPNLVIALSEETRNIFSSALKTEKKYIEITGYPRNDVLLRSKCEPRSGNLKVIFMPTFRGEEGATTDLLEKTNFNVNYVDGFCRDKKIYIDFKLHPFNLPSKESIGQFEKSEFLNFLYEKNIYEKLNSYDVLITDYSSVYFDFLLLDRPIIFFPFDHEHYVSFDRELYYDYAEVTPGPKVNSWEEILNHLEDFENLSNSYKLERDRIRQKFHKYQDAESCKRVYEFINGRIAHN